MIDERVRMFKMLGDKSRLKIVSSLIKEPMYVELISERLGLNPSTVSFHLKKLEHVGLVRSEKDQYYVTYYIDKSKLDFNLLNDIVDTCSVDESEEKREQNYKNKILNNFMIDGKIKVMPVQRKKRNVLLEHIAQDFKIGKEYTEKEVNLMIANYHNDFCLVRREFIIEKMFTRDSGIYKRLK